MTRDGVDEERPTQPLSLNLCLSEFEQLSDLGVRARRRDEDRVLASLGSNFSCTDLDGDTGGSGPRFRHRSCGAVTLRGDAREGLRSEVK